MNFPKIFCILLFFHTSFMAFAQTDNAEPFDCTMPIILKPVLEDIHGKIDLEKNKTPWQHFKCPHATYFFDIKTDEPKRRGMEYDKIVEVSYECPSRHVFKLFVKDGLVMRMKHTEPSGEVHAYSQTIMNKLDRLRFMDEKYTLLSRKCNLAICKGECLWLSLPDGRHQADLDVKAAISMMKLDFIGEMSLSKEHLIYNFCFWDKFMKNASMLYIGEERSSRLKKMPFHTITRVRQEGSDESWIGAGSVHDKINDTGFDAQFHKNMGIQFYTSNEKDKFGEVVSWDENGKEVKRVSSNIFEKMILKSLK